MHNEHKECAKQNPEVTDDKERRILVATLVAFGGGDLFRGQSLCAVNLHVLEERGTFKIHCAFIVVGVFGIKFFGCDEDFPRQWDRTPPPEG